MLELLDDEAELSESILQLEDEQLTKKMELIKVIATLKSSLVCYI